MRHGHGRCVVVFRPIPASQSSKQTKVYQPRVIATVKSHSKGMYRRCHQDMFPHNVDASSSRIVPYLAGTCDCYLSWCFPRFACQKSKSPSLSQVQLFVSHAFLERRGLLMHIHPYILLNSIEPDRLSIRIKRNGHSRSSPTPSSKHKFRREILIDTSAQRTEMSNHA